MKSPVAPEATRQPVLTQRRRLVRANTTGDANAVARIPRTDEHDAAPTSRLINNHANDGAYQELHGWLCREQDAVGSEHAHGAKHTLVPV